ncbi:MAG TPA: hypothetical protein PKN20_12035, partial [Verrucomicrobiota bacterium]|nr:hypothetical protein [Verrucomicrobiota bacterium]HOH40191.1 hypothetical protein [Verrucomicrobiota bacterium]
MTVLAMPLNTMQLLTGNGNRYGVRVIERFFSGVPHPHLLGVYRSDIQQTPMLVFGLPTGGFRTVGSRNLAANPQG